MFQRRKENMFSIIVAIGKNNEIGKKNKLIWHIPEDLKNFKKITTGKTVVMGRKTHESIGKALPNRKNIILTRNFNIKYDENIEVYNDLENFIDKYKNNNEEIFIIGGEEIYKEFLKRDIVEKLYISHVDFQCEDADAYFLQIDYRKWKKQSENQYDNWKFCVYINERK